MKNSIGLLCHVSDCDANNTSDNSSGVFFNFTDTDIRDFMVEKLGHKQKDSFIALLLTCVYVVIFITGVIGNLSTCIVIRRNRHMHSTTNLYLVNLAVADLFITILGKLYTVFSQTSLCRSRTDQPNASFQAVRVIREH